MFVRNKLKTMKLNHFLLIIFCFFTFFESCGAQQNTRFGQIKMWISHDFDQFKVWMNHEYDIKMTTFLSLSVGSGLVMGIIWYYIFSGIKRAEKANTVTDIINSIDPDHLTDTDIINLIDPDHLTDNDDINKQYFNWIKSNNKKNDDCVKHHIMKNNQFMKKFFTHWYDSMGRPSYAPFGSRKTFVQLYFNWHRKQKMENLDLPNSHEAVLNNHLLRFFSSQCLLWNHGGFTIDEFQDFLDTLKITDDEIIPIFSSNFSTFFKCIAEKSNRNKDRLLAWKSLNILYSRVRSCSQWENCIIETLNNTDFSKLFLYNCDYDIGYYILKFLLYFFDNNFPATVFERYEYAVYTSYINDNFYKNFNIIGYEGHKDKKDDYYKDQIVKLINNPEKNPVHEDDLDLVKYLSDEKKLGNINVLKELTVTGQLKNYSNINDVINAMPRLIITYKRFYKFNYARLPFIFSFSDHCHKETLPTSYGRYFLELFHKYDQIEWFFRKKSTLKDLAHFLSYKFPIDFTFTQPSKTKGNVFYNIALSGDVDLFEIIEKEYAPSDYFKIALNMEYEEKQDDANSTNQMAITLSSPIDIAEKQSTELYDAMKKYRNVSPIN